MNRNRKIIIYSCLRCTLLVSTQQQTPNFAKNDVLCATAVAHLATSETIARVRAHNANAHCIDAVVWRANEVWLVARTHDY